MPEASTSPPPLPGSPKLASPGAGSMWQVEFRWFCVSVAAGATGWLAAQLHIAGPGCPIHEWTGYPCPTCGATRSLRSLAEGRLGDALAFNPLIFAVVAGICLFDLYAVAVLSGVLKPFRPDIARRTGDLCRLAIGLLVAANWLWVLRRGL